MSTSIPFEIQEEIMKRVLPVKSLIRFRCVSKQWKSLIDSSKFITHHSLNQTRPHHLLISYFKDSEDKYVSIVDDDSFPLHKFSHEPSPIVRFPSILGCSHGLVCLLAYPSKKLLVVWNPFIRKSVHIALEYEPYALALEYEPYALGFGVCPKTFNPTIIKIGSRNHHEAEVLTLSSRVWRSIPMNLSHKPISFSNNVVVIDGIIHWVVTDLITKNNKKSYGYRIITFDLTTEEFGEVDLPDCLEGLRDLDISKRKESLVVLDYRRSGAVCDIWKMFKNDVQKCLFTKLFTINGNIIGFGKNGQLIIDKKHRCGGYMPELQVIEHGSKRSSGIGIYGSVFKMASYTESLLLINHSDSSMY